MSPTLIFGLTSHGIFHTIISLVAVATGAIALIRDGKISWDNSLGKTFVITTVVVCLTGFGIFQHGGFGKTPCAGYHYFNNPWRGVGCKQGKLGESISVYRAGWLFVDFLFSYCSSRYRICYSASIRCTACFKPGRSAHPDGDWNMLYTFSDWRCIAGEKDAGPRRMT